MNSGNNEFDFFIREKSLSLNDFFNNNFKMTKFIKCDDDGYLMMFYNFLESHFIYKKDDVLLLVNEDFYVDKLNYCLENLHSDIYLKLCSFAELVVSKELIVDCKLVIANNEKKYFAKKFEEDFVKMDVFYNDIFQCEFFLNSKNNDVVVRFIKDIPNVLVTKKFFEERFKNEENKKLKSFYKTAIKKCSLLEMKKEISNVLLPVKKKNTKIKI